MLRDITHKWKAGQDIHSQPWSPQPRNINPGKSVLSLQAWVHVYKQLRSKLEPGHRSCDQGVLSACVTLSYGDFEIRIHCVHPTESTPCVGMDVVSLVLAVLDWCRKSMGFNCVTRFCSLPFNVKGTSYRVCYLRHVFNMQRPLCGAQNEEYSISGEW